MNVNVTLPKKALEFIDREARHRYVSRSAVVRAFVLEALDRKIVVDARRKGFSIRKIAEVYGVSYGRVLEILAETQVDEESPDDEEDQYADLKKIE